MVFTPASIGKIMKYIAALTFFFGSTAFAANPAKILLSKYESQDAGRKCEVRYEDDTLSIVSLYQSRAAYQRYVPIVEVISLDVIRLGYSDNDGRADVYLIRKGRVLTVLGTWEDGENGLDASSFCDLPLMETQNLQRGQEAPLHPGSAQLR